jgi:hypothetical protein
MTMQSFGPRALTPGDGRDWLIQAGQLIGRRLWLFIAVALFAPAGTALLLALPVWGLVAAGAWRMGHADRHRLLLRLALELYGRVGLRPGPRRQPQAVAIGTATV